MRILVVSQYFPPETGGPPNRIASIVDGLKEAGHEVHVITEKPNYPTGIIWEDYRDGVFLDREYDGVPVTYAWVLADPQKRALTRILFYLSFMLTSVAASVRLKGTFDVVLATSPPLFVGLAGWAISKLKRAKFVFDVRDLWPDLAIEMGELRDLRVIGLAKRMERFIYRHADGITAVTESFCRDISRTAKTDVPVGLVMNGTTPSVFDCDAERARLRKELGWEDRFVVTYAGNVGLCQGLHHIVEAAAVLEQETPRLLFAFIGEGAVREHLVKEAERRQIGNVQFLGRVPLEKAAAYMAASDALLVPLADEAIYQKFIPSKLFDSMAAGRPVLLAVDGEARRILDRAEAGLYYAPESGDALAEAVRRLLEHPERGQGMGRKGQAFVREHYDRKVQARKMASFLEAIVQGDEARAIAGSQVAV